MVNHIIETLSRTVMKIPFILLVLCLLVLPVAAVTWERHDNQNINGNDLGWGTPLDISGNDAIAACQQMCLENAGCKAFTYQAPGVGYSGKAECWLKSSYEGPLVTLNGAIIFFKIPDLPAPPAPPQTGTLSVWSNPTGARIYLNNQDTGFTTPHDFMNLPFGGYDVRLTLTGYADDSTGVAVNAGLATSIVRTLILAPPTTGSLSFSSTPSGAAVIVDGVSRDVTPTTVKDLTAGSHTVRITMPGYGAYEGTATVTAGQTTPVTVSLSTLITTTQTTTTQTTKSQTTTTQTTSSGTGFIEVRSQPSGATINLDGVPIEGKTPAKLTNVKAGSHEVVLSLTGYPEWKQTVTVKTGETASINAVLGTSAQTTVGQPAASGTGSLSVSTTPTGAQVYVDGAFIGNSPTKTSGLSAGSHFLTFKMDGYTDLGVGITITTGQTTEYSTSLVSSNAGVNKRTPGFAAVLGILSIACIVAGRRLFSR